MSVSSKQIDELVKLCEVYESTEELQKEQLYYFIEVWLTLYDRVGKRQDTEIFNTMEFYGQLLCCICFRVNDAEIKNMVLKDILECQNLRILSEDTKICELSWRDVLDILFNLQKNFEEIFFPLSESESGEDAFSCSEDIIKLCIFLMSRVGFFIGHKFVLKDTDSREDMSNYFELCDEDVENTSTYQLNNGALREFLDNLHPFLGFSRLLLDAKMLQPVAGEEINSVHACHREASLDDFYALSMISDLHPGAICFYRNKYYHLFHSVSQVIYFNMPSYQRQKQLSLEKLQETDTPHINLLPLLQQLAPQLTILYEHTGAGHCLEHAKHRMSFVVFNKFVLLVDANMQAWWHSNLRHMFSFCLHAMALD